MRRLLAIALASSLVITACGKKSLTLRSSTLTSASSGFPNTDGTTLPSTQNQKLLWSQWEPIISTPENQTNPSAGFVPELPLAVNVGDNFNFTIASDILPEGVKFEIIPFSGGELITNQNCDAKNGSEIKKEVTACLSFKQATTTAVPVLIVFSGPFGVKTKKVFVLVKTSPVPTLVINSVSPVISTQYFSVEPMHKIPAKNSAGEFRVQAVYGNLEATNPRVTPSADITRVGDEYVVKAPTLGSYTFEASWADELGRTQTLSKTVLVGSEIKIQAGEKNSTGISSSRNGGVLSCTSTLAGNITPHVVTDEMAGSNDYLLNIVSGLPATTPTIYRKGDENALKYLFLTLKIPGTTVGAVTCSLKVRDGRFDIQL